MQVYSNCRRYIAERHPLTPVGSKPIRSADSQESEARTCTGVELTATQAEMGLIHFIQHLIKGQMENYTVQHLWEDLLIGVLYMTIIFRLVQKT